MPRWRCRAARGPGGRSQTGGDSGDEAGRRTVSDGSLDGPLRCVLAAVPDRCLEAIVMLLDVVVERGDDAGQHVVGSLGEDARTFVIAFERSVEMGQAEAVVRPVPLQHALIAQSTAEQPQVATLGVVFD